MSGHDDLPDLAFASSDRLVLFTDRLRLAVAAYLASAGIRITKAHPHMLRHTFDTTMLDAGVDLRDVQIAARHADPAPRCATTGHARNWVIGGDFNENDPDAAGSSIHIWSIPRAP